MDHELVILGYYANDPIENAYPDSRFSLEDGNLRLRPVGERDAQEYITFGPLDLIQQFLNRHTSLYPYVAKRVVNLIGPAQAFQQEASSGPQPPDLELTAALIRAIVEEVGQRDKELLLVAIAPLLREEADVIDWERQVRLLQDIAKESDSTAFFDLTPTLRNAAQRRNDVYGKDDAHLDDYGHFVVAEALYQQLVELGLVEKAGSLQPPSARDMNVSGCPSRAP